MNIKDITSPYLTEANEEELAALGQFLIGRADDELTQSSISVDSFLRMAQKMGVNIDSDTLQNLVSKGKIKTIADINKDTVKFKSKEQAGPEQMPFDKAEMTLKNMAHRAAGKRK